MAIAPTKRMRLMASTVFFVVALTRFYPFHGFTFTLNLRRSKTATNIRNHDYIWCCRDGNRQYRDGRYGTRYLVPRPYSQ